MSNLLPRVLMVVTRDVPARAESGRERTMCFIKEALASSAEVEVMRLHSVLERRSAKRMMMLLWTALLGLLTARPVPLQTLLFHASGYVGELDAAIRRFQPDSVYFDGVRSGSYALRLRSRYPQLHLVCDFDDLMSRRIEVLAERRQPISMGYLKRLVPGWVQKHLLDGIVARAIQAYEHRALRSLEKRIAGACGSVVLVSSVDAGHMRMHCPDALVEVIPPFMDVYRPLQELNEIRRFIFIGSDSLLQNRLTIEYLLAAWKRLAPDIDLHIFGKQTGNYQAMERVIFRGFVDSVADAYEEGSVLLAPSFLGGGVKTKVLEAFSHGVVPVGNETTFEGIDADCRGLAMNERQLDALIRQPEEWISELSAAAAIAIRGVMTNHAASLLAERWRNLVQQRET